MNNNNLFTRIDEDFILLILNCEKYKWKANLQKESWLENFNIMPYFHVIGNPHLENDYKFDNLNNLLFVKTLDDYNSLPKKIISAYNAINQVYNYKYIFKTDDDQNMINNKFFSTIQNVLKYKIPRFHYGGKIVNVEKPYLSQYYKIHSELPEYLPVLQTKYCNGRFYFLSNEAVIDLLQKKANIEKEYLEDYAIGFNLDQKFKNNIFHINSDNYFKDLLEP
jgi:hypothetical protein